MYVAWIPLLAIRNRTSPLIIITGVSYPESRNNQDNGLAVNVIMIVVMTTLQMYA